MPLNKIKISLDTKVEFENVYLTELIEALELNLEFDSSGILVSSKTDINLPITNLSELKILVKENVLTKEFGDFIINSDSTFASSLENINTLLNKIFADNKIDYIKGIELVAATKSEVTFKIHSKIGISIPLVIELPITLEHFLIFKFRIKNGLKTFLKVINSILKFSSDKTIIGKDDTVRINIREIVEIPNQILTIIDKWMEEQNGEIILEDDLLKFNLAFKVNKHSSDIHELNS